MVSVALFSHCYVQYTETHWPESNGKGGMLEVFVVCVCVCVCCVLATTVNIYTVGHQLMRLEYKVGDLKNDLTILSLPYLLCKLKRNTVSIIHSKLFV